MVLVRNGGTKQGKDAVAGFFLSGTVEALLSPILGGFAGVQQYVRLLLSDDLTFLSPAPERMINVYAIGANFGLDHIVVKAAAATLVVGLALLAIWRAPLWRWLGAALAGSILVAPHVYAYDASILLLPLLLVLFQSTHRVSRFAAATFLVPLPFLSLWIGPPYTLLPAAALLFFLIALARENYLELFSPTSDRPQEATV